MLELIKTTTTTNKHEMITIIIGEALHHISVPKSVPKLVPKSEYQSQKKFKIRISDLKSEYQSQK